MKPWLALPVGLLAVAAAWFWWAPDALPDGYAAECQLSRDQQLTIACTSDCGPFNRRALRKAAAALGYRLDLVGDLSRLEDAHPRHIDALLIPGGADIDPRWYSSSLPEDLRQRLQRLDHLIVYSNEGRRRDPFEYHLLKNYFRDPGSLQTPLLGICRGMQLLSVAQGLPLHVDIATELGIANRRYRFDTVRVDDGAATIARLVGTAPFSAFELHHQALDLDYLKAHPHRFRQLAVTATSHDGRIAEVLEFAGRPVIGTQFHPELSLAPVRAPLFRWLLVNACRKHTSEPVP